MKHPSVSENPQNPYTRKYSKGRLKNSALRNCSVRGETSICVYGEGLGAKRTNITAGCIPFATKKMTQKGKPACVI